MNWITIIEVGLGVLAALLTYDLVIFGINALRNIEIKKVDKIHRRTRG